MISVVLVNWNSADDTIACVESLLAADRVPARIIVVDNASADDSLDVFARWAASGAGSGSVRGAVQIGRYLEDQGRFEGFGAPAESSREGPGVFIVASGRNGGFGFGCNVGMRLADTLGTDGYWLLNNDCVVAPHALARASEAIRTRPDVIFGTLVRDFLPPHALQATGGGRLSRRTGRTSLVTDYPLLRPLDYIYGASMVFSNACRRAVGDFDERIFMYYEEIDFCLRAAKAGIACELIETDVYHKQGGSQGGASISAWTYVMLNKRYVLNKHFGLGMWTAVYWATLLLRCISPLGDPQAATGSRRALKAMIKEHR